MGLILGLTSAICFASASVCFKIGQRDRETDNGLFLSILVNVVILGVIVAFLTWPAWDAAGFAALVVGGLLGSVGGRSANLKAIRMIGPSRSNAFLAANPVVAAIAGWFVLDETFGIQEAIGGALVVAGLVWLISSRTAPGSPHAGGLPLAGFLWAIGAPIFFGLAFVARKWGLALFPGAVIGAFIGAAAAFALIAAGDARTGMLTDRVRQNLVDVPMWYLAAGVFTTLALLSQFTAFSFLPAWVVGILQGTQGIWTLMLGWLFLRQEEHIDRALVGSVVLVLLGVVLIGLEV